MKIFIDCEWNDWKGQLISMALVAEDGREFYEVLECKNPSEWVAKNVMPILLKSPVSYHEFQERLAVWLRAYNDITLIADWPEDIAHFCNSIVLPGGNRFGPARLTMEVRRDIGNEKSETLHNALSDARAIRDEYAKLNS